MDFSCTEIVSNRHLIQFLGPGEDGNTTCMCMKSGEGVRRQTKFNWFRLYVTARSGGSDSDNGTIQFTKLKFYSNSGRVFSYWNSTAETKSTIKQYVAATVNKGKAGADGGEAAEYGLLTDIKEGKCCWLSGYPSTASPLIITYHLLSLPLDVSVYRKWSWYTANDTSSNSGRNMTLFKLQVSETGQDGTWKTIDENTSAGNIKTTANWSLAYEHELDLSEL